MGSARENTDCGNRHGQCAPDRGADNRAADIGYKAALVKTPSFFKNQFANPATQMLFFRAVADQAKIPVLLYNFPQNTGVDLAAEAVAELSHHPNIVGIKESSGNVEKLLQMVREDEKGISGADRVGHHAGAVARHGLQRRHSWRSRIRRPTRQSRFGKRIVRVSLMLRSIGRTASAGPPNW